MIIRRTTIKEDKKIEEKIRKYGVSKLAFEMDVTPSYISRLINGVAPVTYERYQQILEIISE